MLPSANKRLTKRLGILRNRYLRARIHIVDFLLELSVTTKLLPGCKLHRPIDRLAI